MKPKLTEGQVPLQLLRLSLPMVWGILSVLAFSLADTYFVAQLGTKELAAMSFTFPVVTVLRKRSHGIGDGGFFCHCSRDWPGRSPASAAADHRQPPAVSFNCQLNST